MNGRDFLELGTTPNRAVYWLRLWLFGLGLSLLGSTVAIAFGSPRRGLFLFTLVLVTFVPFAYARLRLHEFLFGPRWLRRSGPRIAATLAGGGVVLDAVMVAQAMTARSSGFEALSAPVVAWFGPVWFSAHAIVFLAVVAIGAARKIGALAARLAAHRQPPAAEPEAPGLTRRELLQELGLVGAAMPFAISLSGVSVSYDFRVEEREIELPGWPRALDGLRVAHLSDIHVGGAMNRERLLRVAELTRAARPEMVLHTGDFLTHRRGDFDAPLYEALSRISAPLGQWACLGNHDFDDPERFVRRLEQAGVTTLRNRRVVLTVGGEPVEIAGIDYLFGRLRWGTNYASIVGRWPGNDRGPRILLNHDPSAFAALPDGAADLVLSGHTHGGHVGLQLGSDRALTVVGLTGIPDQGIFRRGPMQMYVTRCVGFYGYPMRVGIPPEIALLTLRSPRPGSGHPAAV